LLQALQKRPDADLRIWIVRCEGHEHADATHPLGLLCARRERPRPSTADERNETAPPRVKHRADPTVGPPHP
jgi:hypothetical protein